MLPTCKHKVPWGDHCELCDQEHGKPSPSSAGSRLETQSRLWEAINRYVETCGGDPSKRVYGNTARMECVVEVEAIVFSENSRDQ